MVLVLRFKTVRWTVLGLSIVTLWLTGYKYEYQNRYGGRETHNPTWNERILWCLFVDILALMASVPLNISMFIEDFKTRRGKICQTRLDLVKNIPWPHTKATSSQPPSEPSSSIERPSPTAPPSLQPGVTPGEDSSSVEGLMTGEIDSKDIKNKESQVILYSEKTNAWLTGYVERQKILNDVDSKLAAVCAEQICSPTVCNPLNHAFNDCSSDFLKLSQIAQECRDLLKGHETWPEAEQILSIEKDATTHVNSLDRFLRALRAHENF